jgi:hypothetical protein
MTEGKSTGPPTFDKKKIEKKRMKFEREVWYGNFSNDEMKPTTEQIELRKKREEKELKLAVRKHEKSHRGGFQKTKKGKEEAGQK